MDTWSRGGSRGGEEGRHLSSDAYSLIVLGWSKLKTDMVSSSRSLTWSFRYVW
ncbi:hypothetical protein RSAG8_10984, partial [Rhizoctonia solani AG-8 WAC10335]